MKNKKDRFSSMYKKGGEKQDWISNKISKIMNEDPSIPQKQAIAMAFSMYEREFQAGGVVGQTPNQFSPETDLIQKVWNPALQMYVPSTSANMQSAGNTPLNFGVPSPIQTQVGQLPEWNIPNISTTQEQTAPVTQSNSTWNPNATLDAMLAQQLPPTPTFDKSTLNPEDVIQSTGTGSGLTQQEYASTLDGAMMTQYGEDLRSNTANNTMGEKSGTKVNNSSSQGTNFQPMQFVNPYGGVDIPTAASFLGQSIENKDALGIVAGGLKTGLGVARNIFGGMGAQRVRNEGVKNYMDNQRDMMVGKAQTFEYGGEYPDFQDGGAFKAEQFLNPVTTFEEEQKTKAPQKPVARILQNVQTNETKQGLPAGNYTKVEYKDGTFDYLTPDGYQDFQRMNNYRLYQEAQTKKTTPVSVGEPVAMFQDGGEAQQGQDQMQQIFQMVTEALQQGATPEEVAQQLLQMGVPEEMVNQILQQVMSQTQAPQQAQEQPVMRDGGEILGMLKNKTIIGFNYNKDKDTYEIEYK